MKYLGSAWDNQWLDMNESEDLVAERNALFGNGRQCAHDLWTGVPDGDENYEPVHREGIYDERLFTDRILQHIDASDQSKPMFIVSHILCHSP